MSRNKWHQRGKSWCHQARQATGKRLVLLLLRGGAYHLAWRVYLRLGNGKEK